MDDRMIQICFCKLLLDADYFGFQSVEFQGFLVASSVCSGCGTPTLSQGAKFVHSMMKSKKYLQKSEFCHFECGEGGKVSSGFWSKSRNVWRGHLLARQV